MLKDEKLQKIIAQTGMASRREAENWIKEGRVSVNGSISELGDRATPTDKIRVDGKVLQRVDKEAFQRRMLAYHKPDGEICSRKDPEGRVSVFDNLPTVRNSRWINVGRLDLNSSGLIFFTNDGELANRLMHPSHQIMRKYAVRVRGQVTEEILKALTEGVELDDGMAKFESVVDAGGEGSNHWYTVTLAEGRNREVRRMWEAFEIQVSRLHRIQYGPYDLPRSLKRGRWIELTPQELSKFEALVDLTPTALPPGHKRANEKQTSNKRLKARKVTRK